MKKAIYLAEAVNREKIYEISAAPEYSEWTVSIRFFLTGTGNQKNTSTHMS